MSEDVTATLEAALTTEVARMYEEVAAHPDGDYHFYTGRRAAEMCGYRPEDLDAMPAGAVAAFAGVGCPIERAGFKRVRSSVVGGFRFRKASTQDAAEQHGVKAVVFTAEKPAA